MASIHAEVPNDADIEEAHELIDRIERDAVDELGILLVIHMDPIEMRDETGDDGERRSGSRIKGTGFSVQHS